MTFFRKIFALWYWREFRATEPAYSARWMLIVGMSCIAVALTWFDESLLFTHTKAVKAAERLSNHLAGVYGASGIDAFSFRLHPLVPRLLPIHDPFDRLLATQSIRI